MLWGMNKRFVKLLFVSIFLSNFMLTPSSDAVTIKNGVACNKANATVKVGSKLYKCAKNPYVTPTKRTWTLTGCLTAYALWKDSKQQYEDFKDIAKLAGAEGEKTMNELQASINSLEITMKTQACKKGA